MRRDLAVRALTRNNERVKLVGFNQHVAGSGAERVASGWGGAPQDHTSTLHAQTFLCTCLSNLTSKGVYKNVQGQFLAPHDSIRSVQQNPPLHDCMPGLRNDCRDLFSDPPRAHETQGTAFPEDRPSFQLQPGQSKADPERIDSSPILVKNM